jgi:hypothetical protein
MGWSFRKSYKFGPFRINLSKSGIGASTGLGGANVSTGPRGTYFSISNSGFRFYKKIGSLFNISRSLTKPKYTSSINPNIAKSPNSANNIQKSVNNVGSYATVNPSVNSIGANYSYSNSADIQALEFKKEIIAIITSNSFGKLDFDELVKSRKIDPKIAKQVSEDIFRSFCISVVADRKISIEENNKLKLLAKFLKIDESNAALLLRRSI